MMVKGYRVSLPQLVILIITFIILSQLFSVWDQEQKPYTSYMSRGDWKFNPDIHNNVHTLSHEQCDVAFPKMYYSIEQAVSRRQGKKYELKDIEIAQGRCMMRLMIYDNELFIIDTGTIEKCYVTNGNERERILGTLAQIDRALATSPQSDPAVPNIEFAISLDDLPLRSKGNMALWGYTRQDGPEYKDVWMMPNYAYWSWNYTHAPSWNSLVKEIADSENQLSWDQKDPRAVWRGKIKMAKLRSELVRIGEGKRWSDIKPVVINNATDVNTKDVMNLRDFCGYKYTVQTEGTSYSGRLKYLQLCRSALITHPLQWQEIHTHLMQVAGPDANFIEAADNFKNLEQVMEYFVNHDAEAHEIAKNSYETFARQYLTPASITCYWRRLFWSYRSVQGWEPQLYYRDEQGKKVMRATPWTAFAANWPKDPSIIP